jgi:hypothetical protein
MSTIARLLTAALFVCAFACAGGAARSQATPAPAATPADPCGSILSIVNRPSFGTGVCTVRTGHADIEGGYTNTITTGAGGGATAVYPQALIRFGTGDPHFDLEIGAPSAVRSTVGGIATSGSSDASIGAKYVLGYSAKADWGVSGVVTVPSGTPAFSAGRAQYSGSFNWAYTVNPEFALSGSLGANEFAGVGAAGVPKSYFSFMPSIALTAALPGGPSQIGVEYAYFTAAGPGLGGKSWIDAIYQRDLGPHVQFDVEYGFSPTTIGGQQQHYVGAGLSFMN